MASELIFETDTNYGGYRVKTGQSTTDSVVVIPDTYNNVPVTSIAGTAFNDKLQLKEVTIGKNIKFIGNNAFDGCKNLEKIYYNAANASVDNSAVVCRTPFSACGTDSGGIEVIIGETVEEIPAYLFKPYHYGLSDAVGANIKQVTFRPGLVKINKDAFLGCNFTSVSLPANLSSLGAVNSTAFESTVTISYFPLEEYPLVGFTYNGQHSICNFGLYRTSDGNRYNDNLTPPLNDKTADVPGGEGQYFFKTNYKPRQFLIPVAFDNLPESKYRRLREWLNGTEVHELIFDETPYKVYSAKVTGTPQLKTVCFDENGTRIYKGEGTIQFTCHYPFAHTPTKINGVPKDGRKILNYNYTTKDEWSLSGLLREDEFVEGLNMGDLPAPFKVTKAGTTSKETSFQVGPCAITTKIDCTDLEWDSRTGLVLGKVNQSEKSTPIPYTGTSYGALAVGMNTVNIPTGATLAYSFWYY